MYMGMAPSPSTESSSTWNSITYRGGSHGGSVSSGRGCIIGGSLRASCAIPTGPRGEHHIFCAPSGMRWQCRLSVGSYAMSGSVHSASITDPGLQCMIILSTASEYRWRPTSKRRPDLVWSLEL